MAATLNNIQQKSVDTIDTNLSLRAGAGTGKTKVLTERYLNIIEKGNLTETREFEEILAITFTNKAAEEMKGRILKSIKARRNEEKFRKLYKYFSKANIFTIHGFCAKVIKENPLTAGVDPDFQIADENMAGLMLSESCEEILNSELKNPVFIEFLIKRKDMNIKKLSENIKALYVNIRNNSFEINELKKMHSDFMKRINDNPDYSNLLRLIDEYAELVKRGNFPKFYNSDEYSEFINKRNADFLPVIKESLGTSKGEDKETLRSEINREIDILSLVREKEIEKYYELIFDILVKIDNRYEEKKREKSLLDYQDLQFKAMKVVEKTDRYRYKYIMIDEFQDTDRLQAVLFGKLSRLADGNAHIFVVGDPKQSIYGFRGSNLKEYNKFTDKIKEKGQELVMEENYRSSEMLMNSFNSIFGEIMPELYDPLEAKAAGIDNFKIQIIEADENSIEEGEEDRSIIEAKVIAAKIDSMLKEGIKEKDIAVLYRRKANIEILEKILIEKGIAVNNTAVDFVNKREIKDILILLKAVSNKQDFLSFLSYLRSPMAGLSDNSLVIIAEYFDRNKFELDEEYYNLLEEKELQLFKNAYEKTLYLRKIKPVLSLSDLIRKAVKINEYYEISSVLYGKSAVENIYRLIEIAEDFEKDYSLNITEFFKYINTVTIDPVGKDSAVSLMTIHKSKGLEFENVILAEMGNRFNLKMNDSFFAVSENGLAFNFEEIHSKYSLIKEETKEESVKEELRMFYVALTRAKKRLILSFDIKEKGEANSYRGLIEKYLENTGNSEIFQYEKIKADNTHKSSDRSIDKSIFEIEPKSSAYSLIKNKYISKVKKVKYYSASAFMVFRKSRREYYRRYILGEEVVDNRLSQDESLILDPIIRGNIIHRYAEKNPQDIDSFIDESLRDYGIVKNEGIVTLLKEQMANYDESLKGEVLYRELEFYYRLRNGIIHGFIDQVRNENGTVILDFKTGYDTDEKNLEYYYPQLQIYSYVYEKITGNRVKEAKLLMLSTGEEIKVDISENAVKDVIDEFEDFIDFVENHRDMKDYIN